MSDILKFISLGIAITATIGPVTIITIKRGLKDGFFSAFVTNMGAVLVDGLYLLLIFFCFSSFFNNALFRVILGTIGVLFLFYLGVESIREYFKKNLLVRPIKYSASSAFVTGVLINVTNPMSPIAWLGFYGIFSSDSAYNPSDIRFLFNVGWVIVGAVICGFIISLMSHMGKRFVNEKILRYVSLLAGIVLIGFSLYLGDSVFKTFL